MDLSQIFGILAGLTAFLAYGFYFNQIRKGQTIPNPSSWAIWFLVSIINSVTYFQVVGQNLNQAFAALAVMLSMGLIFFYSLHKSRFARISFIEIACFILAIIVGVFWQLTADDRTANLLLQAIYVIAYVPTVAGLLRGTGKEYPVSWITAVIAYSFSIAAILLDYNGDWATFVFPLVNGVMGNGLVVAIIYYKNKSNGQTPQIKRKKVRTKA